MVNVWVVPMSRSRPGVPRSAVAQRPAAVVGAQPSGRQPSIVVTSGSAASTSASQKGGSTQTLSEKSSVWSPK